MDKKKTAVFTFCGKESPREQLHVVYDLGMKCDDCIKNWKPEEREMNGELVNVFVLKGLKSRRKRK